MCGRMACTLSKEKIQKACSTLDPNTKSYKELKWEDGPNGGHTYTPSHNVCPTNVTPVIVGGVDGPILKPMMWGVIPPWHKGEYNTHKLSTNNCRIENVLSSKLYKPLLQRGQRCVVICDGYYEWQTTKKKKNKQPYFIYAPQPDGVEIDNPDSWSEEFSPELGWPGPRLLYMAALFSPWTSPKGEEFIAYSIVTMESSSTISWLHDRMPAILNSDAEVLAWLNYGGSSAEQALSLLQPVKIFKWHPVSTEVNNSRNKYTSLNKAIELTEEKKPSKSAELMKSWLLKRKSDQKRSSEGKDTTEPDPKKSKQFS